MNLTRKTASPAIFSQTVEPFRVMVLDDRRRPVSLGTVRARHFLAGSITGYYVELDDGTRMSVAPHQIAAAENVIAPPAAIWAARRVSGHKCAECSEAVTP